MSVIRVVKSRNFSIMSNYHLQDRNLSLRAKGMLTVILSLPDDWKHSVRGYAKILKEGVDAINAVLRELEKYGYIVRVQTRDDAGRMGECDYTIYEIPQTGQPHDDAPQAPHLRQDEPPAALPDSPCTENPYTVPPCTDTPPQLNTNYMAEKTYIPTTQKSIYPSIMRATGNDGRMDGKRGRMDYVQTLADVQDRIDCAILAEEYGENAYVCAQIIAEVLCNEAKYYTIEGQKCPAELIRARYARLRSLDIIAVLDALRDGGYKPRNAKAYLRTALYNTAATPLV